MSTRQLKIAGIVLWGSAGLLIFGIIVGFPLFKPYLQALVAVAETPVTPTATVLPVLPAGTPMPAPALLPFDEGMVITGTPIMVTPTVIPTPVPDVEMGEMLSPLATPTAADAHVHVVGTKPRHVQIPAIDLDAPVEAIGWTAVEVNGVQQAMWNVPEWRAAGWHRTSAKLGVPGNSVLNGHNTSKGEVFRDLYKLTPGALVLVEGEDGQIYTYEVKEKYILPEAGQSLEVRIQNAAYIQPTADERLTLVTCYPYASLANRLVIIAYPVPSEGMDPESHTISEEE
ncbi:MAG: sortase [Anaerolineae bacterium]|nr:sortase [Anaerolineae bacterium]